MKSKWRYQRAKQCHSFKLECEIKISACVLDQCILGESNIMHCTPRSQSMDAFLISYPYNVPCKCVHTLVHSFIDLYIIYLLKYILCIRVCIYVCACKFDIKYKVQARSMCPIYICSIHHYIKLMKSNACMFWIKCKRYKAHLYFSTIIVV